LSAAPTITPTPHKTAKGKGTTSVKKK
jgi:hypothetical protein